MSGEKRKEKENKNTTFADMCGDNTKVPKYFNQIYLMYYVKQSLIFIKFFKHRMLFKIINKRFVFQIISKISFYQTTISQSYIWMETIKIVFQ